MGGGKQLEDVLIVSPFSDNSDISVGDKVRRLLPFGSRGKKGARISLQSDWHHWKYVPVLPSDVFAVAGTLLELSGAFGHYNASQERLPPVSNPSLWLSDEDREGINLAAKEWDHSLATTATVKDDLLVQKYWHDLITHALWPLTARPYVTEQIQARWWIAALRLMIAADEAASGVGFDPTSTSNGAATAFQSLIHARNLEFLTEHRVADGGVLLPSHMSSLTTIVDKDIVCVQPKCRVPQVGCTTRVFSRNLALLRQRGYVRCHWLSPPGEQQASNGHALNLLLVPYPLKVSERDFQPMENAESKEGVRGSHWRNFAIKQNWLSDCDVIDLVLTLLKHAKDKNGPVHGIVLPEYAVDYEQFDKLAIAVREIAPELEFVISGSSSNCHQQKGNFVLTRHFQFVGEASDPTAITTSRCKHHRWKIESNQIETYGLDATLSDKQIWWENVNLGMREVHLHALRSSSAYSVMICEDLARSDPCHETVRSLGPNLVFVLLMDGPQLSNRWAARYATSLAEDPGASVLTLTSLGLLELSNQTLSKKFPEFTPSRTIGLWKQEDQGAIPIDCPEGAGAVFLPLNGEMVEEFTIDGRRIENACRWSIGEPEAIPM